MGNYVKALIKMEDGSTREYAAFAVPELPADATVGGVCAGVCNTLMTFMPVEFAVACTGHDLRHISAFFEYYDITVQKVIPAAVVLSGFPSFLWGQMGNGSVPASLDALQVYT